MNGAIKLMLLKPPDRAPAGADSGPTRARRRQVLLAIGLVGLVALTNLRLPLRTFRQLAREPQGGQTEAFLRRCRRLESLMPAGGRIGYLSLAGNQPAALQDAQHRLLQYAFAPRKIEPFAGQDLVVVQTDEPGAALEMAHERGWQIVSDAGAGLLAFRTMSDVLPSISPGLAVSTTAEGR